MTKAFIPLIALILCGCSSNSAKQSSVSDLVVGEQGAASVQMYVYPSKRGSKSQSGYYLEFDLESNSAGAYRYKD